MEFSEQLASDAAATAVLIDDIVRTDQSSAQRLREAMIYAVMSGGKRLQAALVLGAARLSDEGSQQPGRYVWRRHWKCCMPIRWCMTIYRRWMTLQRGVASPAVM